MPTQYDAPYYRSQGMRLKEQGLYDEAIVAYNEAIKLEPSNDVTYVMKGHILIDLGRPEEALSSYDKAIEVDLRCEYTECTYYFKGVTLEALGRLEEALSSYDKAIKADLSYMSTYYALSYCHKGKILNQLGRESEALSCFDEAFKIIKDEPRHSYPRKSDMSYIDESLEDRKKLLEKLTKPESPSDSTQDTTADPLSRKDEEEEGEFVETFDGSLEGSKERQDAESVEEEEDEDEKHQSSNEEESITPHNPTESDLFEAAPRDTTLDTVSPEDEGRKGHQAAESVEEGDYEEESTAHDHDTESGLLEDAPRNTTLDTADPLSHKDEEEESVEMPSTMEEYKEHQDTPHEEGGSVEAFDDPREGSEERQAVNEGSTTPHNPTESSLLGDVLRIITLDTVSPEDEGREGHQAANEGSITAHNSIESDLLEAAPCTHSEYKVEATGCCAGGCALM
ncbi:MAG: tetratricopeptide repeat protein [Pseudomonadota bacterium]